MSFELFWKQVLKKEKAPFLLPLFSLLAFFYSGLLRIRHFLYDKNFLKSQSVPCFVLSIGNIALGGTGKTPFTLFLAKKLKDKKKLAILSRGYKANISEKTPYLVKKSDPSEKVGDEPLLLSQKLSFPVYIGKNRVESAKRAIEKGADLLLLDDGMQYRALKKNIEIALLDAEEPFDALFPRGHLRDLKERLQGVSLIALYPISSKKQAEELEKKVRAVTKAPVIGLSIELTIPTGIEKAAVFCGIAKPNRWIEQLQARGVTIVEKLILADHEALSEKALRAFWQKAKKSGASILLCTEKDGVKISSLLKKELPIVEIPLKIEVSYHPALLEEMIEKIEGS